MRRDLSNDRGFYFQVRIMPGQTATIESEGIIIQINGIACPD
jgi:hypothetical protein